MIGGTATGHEPVLIGSMESFGRQRKIAVEGRDCFVLEIICLELFENDTFVFPLERLLGYR